MASVPTPPPQKPTRLSSLFTCCLRRRTLTSAPVQHALTTSAFSAVASNSTNVGGASQTSAKALADFNAALGNLEIDAALDVRATNIASKVEEYANHRLPQSLAETKLEPEHLTLLSLAATFAKEVYAKGPRVEDGYHFTQASIADGTKAVACSFSERNVVVVAVKGSKKMIDWAVNFNDKADRADEFLGDGIPGCHSGFLETARSMVGLVARSLETTLEPREPSDQPIDLLFAGHSAGGAVAALLYYHMRRSGTPASPLTTLKSRFRHIHCITFGAPPITSVPLPPPATTSPELFAAFINEGDPVVRADGPYVNSLIQLIVSRRPSRPTLSPAAASEETASALFTRGSDGYTWTPPAPVYHNAGHLLVLRDADPDGEGDRIGVVRVTGEQLGGAVFGDPFKHSMALYLERAKRLVQERVVSDSAWM